MKPNAYLAHHDHRAQVGVFHLQTQLCVIIVYCDVNYSKQSLSNLDNYLYSVFTQQLQMCLSFNS